MLKMLNLKKNSGVYIFSALFLILNKNETILLFD